MQKPGRPAKSAGLYWPQGRMQRRGVRPIGAAFPGFPGPSPVGFGDVPFCYDDANKDGRTRMLQAKAAVLGTVLIGALAFAAMAQSLPKPSLDFDFFKVKVEPIFLQKRSGHTRCYVCHAQSNNALNREKLAPGQNQWTREQSRHNFAVVAKLVNPGDPTTSRLLLHPLAPEGGGDS